MFKILQVNLGRARAAHDLMWATAVKEGIDVVVIMEAKQKDMCTKGLDNGYEWDMAVAIMNNRQHKEKKRLCLPRGKWNPVLCYVHITKHSDPGVQAKGG